jgi:hypothetical protein
LEWKCVTRGRFSLLVGHVGGKCIEADAAGLVAAVSDQLDNFFGCMFGRQGACDTLTDFQSPDDVPEVFPGFVNIADGQNDVSMSRRS